jgi:hypothetical protein
VTQWLRADAKGRPIGVDRETEQGVLRGYIMAEEGPFKTGRGEFGKKALRQIIKLCNGTPTGLKCRMGHPNESDDGVGKFLGRVRSAWYEEYPSKGPIGDPLLQLGRVRGDLYFAESAHEVPGKGDLAAYFMKRAEEDAESFSSSLVLDCEQEYRLEKDGRPLRDATGKELPPLWMPLKLYASDLVDDGDAVAGGLLSSGDELSMLTQDMLRQGCDLLDRQFAGKDRAFIRSHLDAFVGRYLANRFGDEEAPERTDELTKDRLRLLVLRANAEGVGV